MTGWNCVLLLVRNKNLKILKCMFLTEKQRGFSGFGCFLFFFQVLICPHCWINFSTLDSPLTLLHPMHITCVWLIEQENSPGDGRYITHYLPSLGLQLSFSLTLQKQCQSKWWAGKFPCLSFSDSSGTWASSSQLLWWGISASCDCTLGESEL